MARRLQTRSNCQVLIYEKFLFFKEKKVSSGTLLGQLARKPRKDNTISVNFSRFFTKFIRPVGKLNCVTPPFLSLAGSLLNNEIIANGTDQIGVGAYFLVCAFIYRTVSGFYLLFFSFFFSKPF